jgi:hypothetical protein
MQPAIRYFNTPISDSLEVGYFTKAEVFKLFAQHEIATG